jgi:hypothetical protein
MAKLLYHTVEGLALALRVYSSTKIALRDVNRLMEFLNVTLDLED